MKITKMCPFCGKVTAKEFTDEEVRAYDSGKNILEAMPERDAFDREFIISGMCDPCSSKTFNVPIPGDTSWGDRVGECPCCGCNIYSIKNKEESGEFVCPSCHTHSKLIGDELVDVEEW